MKTEAQKRYREYLKTEHWATMRRLSLQRANYACQVCSGLTLLQVHHRTYARVGEELLSDLVVLCEDCHATHHSRKKEAPGRGISERDFDDIEDIDRLTPARLVGVVGLDGGQFHSKLTAGEFRELVKVVAELAVDGWEDKVLLARHWALRDIASERG